MNVVWFRTDLRIQNNPALTSAINNGSVVAVYIATPEQWRKHDDAAIKLDFWRRNLVCLKSELTKIQVPLLCFQVPSYRQIPDLLSDVLEKLQAKAIYFNQEFALNERNRDSKVENELAQKHIDCHSYPSEVLLKPGTVLNGQGEPFKVFTPFARKARTLIATAQALVSHKRLANKHPANNIPAIPSNLNIDQIEWPLQKASWQELWPAGENAALKKLDGFCQSGLDGYEKNRDFPAINGTSMLSPWLNAGVISIQTCWQNASQMSDSKGCQTWQNELLWREFYRHLLFHYAALSRSENFNSKYDQLQWRTDQEDFQKWCQGETGIPIVDAAMKQLLQTGWMHNRLRMITAMFLTKHLLIDWRWGEQWFMKHLIDGDYAANNGGWQWSASTGTDAVPYFRIFNPVTQSRRFDAEGNFIRKFLPALEALDNKAIHDPGLLKPDIYPGPIVDLKQGRERALAAFKSC